MIFLTGDTHRMMDIKKLSEEEFPEQKLLTKKDYVIICGDFGAVWTGDEKDDEILEYHNTRNYTTLFVGGNHENYNAINSYPVEEWNGGKIHRIRENVIHLMNGQVFTLDGLRFFVMGGATSVDKIWREENVSWWPQEEPSEAEFKEAFDNLAKVQNNINFVLSHTIPEKVRMNVFGIYTDFINYDSGVEKFLNLILENIYYEKWFAGHIHIDRDFPEYKLRILYNGVVKVS